MSRRHPKQFRPSIQQRARAAADTRRLSHRPITEKGGTPTVSVVIAWVNPLELLEPGLAALAQQTGSVSLEIIVVTRHGVEAQKLLRAKHPEVILLAAPSGTPITSLRSIGIQHAAGKFVAVTEDHCVPSRDWIAGIKRRLDVGSDVVGGPVENDCTTRWRDWAAFLTEYAGAIASSADESASKNGEIASLRETTSLSGNNVAYRRELLDGLRATLDRGLWESFYHEQLMAQGVKMRFDPLLLVRHRRPFDFWYFISQRYHFCRSFAEMRCRQAAWSLWQRGKYGAGSILLPPLLLGRGIASILRKGRLVGRYFSCVPLIAVYLMAGAAGEMIGYFAGGGRSLERVE